MKKFFTLLLFSGLCLGAKAQIRGWGNIDTADLKLTSCDFEKDANAMVLFDRAKIVFTMVGNVMERHRRIKILNEKGKEEGNVKIEYHNLYGVDHILSIEAQTINLEDGKIVITRVDPKLFYPEHTDVNKDAVVFSFPNVKPGSVLEYRYSLGRNISTNFPAWYFQSDIPTRYSEFIAFFDSHLKLKSLTRLNSPLSKDSSLTNGHFWSMNNVQSSKKEAFTRSDEESRQSLALELESVELDGKSEQLLDNWAAVGKRLATDKDYYKEWDQHLSGEETLLKQAASLKTADEKIAYLFNEVKSSISWNGYEGWRSAGEIKNAWKKRSGNSAEVNTILYHLLKKSGIKAYPMLVSTRDNGLLQKDFVNIFQINNMVVYVPVDTARFYLLDATNKYNKYDEVPYNYLNSFGLCLDKEHEKYDMIFLDAKTPAREYIQITAEITPDARMGGKGEISSLKYNKTNELQLYKKEGEKKYEEFLTDNDNNLKLTNLKMNNMDVDTLPLQQVFDFTNDLNTSDNYIFFSPNMFTPLHENPFLSERRNADIDFGYGNYRVINGRYKIPAGYKVESLPKNSSIVLPDRGIRFKRLLAIDDGYITLHYEIDINRTTFDKSEYPTIHDFYKKMYEMLNEQIVLKKS